MPGCPNTRSVIGVTVGVTVDIVVAVIFVLGEETDKKSVDSPHLFFLLQAGGSTLLRCDRVCRVVLQKIKVIGRRKWFGLFCVIDIEQEDTTIAMLSLGNRF
jgi:hypothetical protein